MSIDNIFLTASRSKLRFPSVIGQLTVEDLWDIPLTTASARKASIENIGAALVARQSELQGANFLTTTTPSPEKAQVDLAVAILRKVAEIRQAENAEKTMAAARESERRRLDDLIRQREGQEMPLDELRARRDALS